MQIRSTFSTEAEASKTNRILKQLLKKILQMARSILKLLQYLLLFQTVPEKISSVDFEFLAVRVFNHLNQGNVENEQVLTKETSSLSIRYLQDPEQEG